MVYSYNLLAEKIAESIENRSLPAYPENLYQPINYILNLSGKRIRPLLVLLATDLFDHDRVNEAIPAALAIEYFHNFSLLHDDIMDRAPLRRGQPTVHQKWNDSVAILSGDALLVKAYEQISLSESKYIPALLKIFNRIAIEVCEGQQLDMDFEKKDNVSQEEYVNMIRLKTSVLLGGALEMGAVVSEASEKDRQCIYEFGVNLGIAFQLQDDILDAFGDPESFGKQVGGDIIVNKKTILHIILKELLSKDDSSLFEKILLLDEAHADEKISEMKNLYSMYHIKEKADLLKVAYTNLAFENLKAIEVEENKKEELYKLADRLMYREQ